jgi:tryptophan synthase alpha chain
MNAIKQVFQKQKQQGYGCLIGYITAGDPTPERTVEIADALIKGGVDVLELGLPFSDPIADGPTIQAASLRALNAGTTPMRVVEIAGQIKAKHPDVPVVIMTYYNPVFKLGIERFLASAKAAGVDGFIVPDLPVEEAADYRKAASEAALDTIFLASPATSKERLERIVAASSGFLYLVSRFGVTGTQTAVADTTVELIRKVQPVTANRVPLAVGFGISKPEHIKRIIAAGADAAIVGSAFINIVAGSSNPETMLKELETAAHSLKAATKSE